MKAPGCSVRNDKELLKLAYNAKSLRYLYRDWPKYFNRRGYLGVFFKQNSPQSKSYTRKTRTTGERRKFASWRPVNGREVYAGFIDAPKNPDRILMSFTRTSGRAPKYGSEGTSARCGESIEGILEVRYPNSRPTRIGCARVDTSSLAPFFEDPNATQVNPAANIQELIDVLDAASPDVAIELMSVGLDAFTTDINSLVMLNTRYSHLNIKLTVLVSPYFAFPGVFKGSCEPRPVRHI
ncbi:hypothetical protein BDZ85DRAFT_284019 [Elsinoe ampelina]|uniref:Uncharacterized protein n=1 Tax=Elsinoe ampelina TaxID=302913 RepID=A0A6A6G6G2_9PEZI|nr:hypothetical protein BDZ85DRAFT_284019 [Elsinoe ampelina]